MKISTSALLFLSSMTAVGAAPQGMRATDATPRQLADKVLTYIGENQGSYGECEGDCDSSWDCDVSGFGDECLCVFVDG